MPSASVGAELIWLRTNGSREDFVVRSREVVNDPIRCAELLKDLLGFIKDGESELKRSSLELLTIFGSKIDTFRSEMVEKILIESFYLIFSHQRIAEIARLNRQPSENSSSVLKEQIALLLSFLSTLIDLRLKGGLVIARETATFFSGDRIERYIMERIGI